MHRSLKEAPAATTESGHQAIARRSLSAQPEPAQTPLITS